MTEDRPKAFVAMQFQDDHWKDKTYRIISEELESAGYEALRADQLRTSGPVVDEVCQLLKDADLVVIDCSGNSHSVSYEIGYCHGVGRSPATTLLLRNDASLPFNYRHYRSRIYKDRKHLRRLIRDYLDITEPVLDEMYGYAVTFDYSEDAVFGFIMDGAECVIEAILDLGYSGRMEIFSYEHFFTGQRTFTVGAALRQRSAKATPEYDFWKKMMKKIEAKLPRFKNRICLSQNSPEYASKRDMKEHMLFCGAAELKNGQIVRQIDSEEYDFIQSYLDRKEEKKNQDD